MKKFLSKYLSQISLFPTVALLVMTSFMLVTAMQDYSAAKHTLDNAQLVKLTSGLVHEMQKERGMTAGFIGSKGKNFSSEILAQRSKVDEKHSTLNEYLTQHEFNEAITETLSHFANHLLSLEATRNQVTALSMELSNALPYYTKANSILLHLNSVLAKSASNLEGMQMLNTLYNLSYTKERSGIERAVLSNAFAKKKFTDASYDAFLKLSTKQTVYFDVAEEVASDEFKKVLDAVLVSAESKKVNEYRQYVIENHKNELTKSATDWFSAATARINLLKTTEDSLLKLTIASAESATSFYFFLAIGKVTFFIFIVLLAYVIYTTLQNSQKQSNLIKRIMSRVELEHDISKSIDVVAQDNLGKIAELLNKTFTRLRNDFSVFQKNSSGIATESKNTAAITLQSKANLQQQKESVAKTLSLAESVSEGITSNTEEIKKSAHYAEESKSSAIKGEGVVQEAVTGIKKTAEDIVKANDEIDRVAKNVTDIVGMVDVIHSVADQTNLLALNAAIEAARAGEQGRGFAVVADEVRALAKRTQDSTEEISSIINYLTDSSKAASRLIKASNEQAAASVGLAENVHTVLHDIVNNMSQLNDVNQTISSSAEEQLQNIIGVTDIIREIDVHATENTEGAEIMSDSATQLSVIAETMLEQIQQYKVK